MSDTYEHIAFYKFVHLDDPDAVVPIVHELVDGMRGSVLLATEGVNGMLAGTPAQVDTAIDSLTNDSRLSGVFDGMLFKRTGCGDRLPFRRLRVRTRDQIVTFGEPIDAPARVSDIAAADVSPQEWRELITQDNVVLIDNRNSFEYKVGRFNGAIDPKVGRFRDFAEYVKAHAEHWREEGKTIAMYCTGGIRCEKASAWMQDLGLDVRQLEGGILNYFAHMPDAENDWDGECFVFDDRVTLDTKLQLTQTSRDEVEDNDPARLNTPFQP